MNIRQYAEINDGAVVRVVGGSPNYPIADTHPDLIDPKQCGEEVRPGWLYINGLFSPPATQTLNLIALKIDYQQLVDAQAETERLKYITPGTGQAMTYQQKVAEAQAFKAASNPKPEDYPILGSEVGITAPTLSEVADTVLTAYRQWQQIGAMIEAIRLGAKRDIDASTTEAAARAVVDAIVWPLAQQGGTDNE